MIVRQLDDKLVLSPFQEKINLDISDVVSIEASQIDTWGAERDYLHTRMLVIRSEDSKGEGTVVVIALDARSKEALAIKEGPPD